MIAKRISAVFLGLLALAFCKTGIEALLNPQAVLANVGIELTTIAGLSSIRAVYGGMHLIFGLFCCWGIFKNQSYALILVLLYTAGFVLGRSISWAVDGLPNDFVFTWFITETFSLGASIILIRLLRKNQFSISTPYPDTAITKQSGE